MAQTRSTVAKGPQVFRNIQEVAAMPNLIEVQKASYDQFLQVMRAEGGRSDEGLAGGLQVGISRFPILPALRCWNLCPTNSNFRNTTLMSAVSAT
jgi:DNA-directed RNA polymerase beta subunit